jgi:hypothetical protein
MTAVWAGLGAVTGASVGMEGGGTIGAIAAMMAGMVELAILGAIFGLIGGRPREALLGAMGGVIVGLTMGVAGGHVPVVLVADFGLVVGAIAGATLRPYVQLLSLPVVLLGRILAVRHRHPTVIAVMREDLIEHQPIPPVASTPRISRRPSTSRP